MKKETKEGRDEFNKWYKENIINCPNCKIDINIKLNLLKERQRILKLIDEIRKKKEHYKVTMAMIELKQKIKQK